MKVQEVILRAMAKKITWWQAAEIIGISDRQMRRLAIVRRLSLSEAYDPGAPSGKDEHEFLEACGNLSIQCRIRRSWERQRLLSLPALIGCDEFPVGYSFAGCFPAEPASASPTGNDSQQSMLPYNDFSANGNNPLNSMSQPKGALQNVFHPFEGVAPEGRGIALKHSQRQIPTQSTNIFYKSDTIPS